MTDVCLTSTDQLHGEIIKLLEVVGAVGDLVWGITYEQWPVTIILIIKTRAIEKHGTKPR